MDYYTHILDEVMEKWLGPNFDNSILSNSTPYRMLALLLDDPWIEPPDEHKPPQLRQYQRDYIVDISKPEIRRKLDMLNGPYFNTIMKILELRIFNEDSESNSNQNERLQPHDQPLRLYQGDGYLYPDDTAPAKPT